MSSVCCIKNLSLFENTYALLHIFVFIGEIKINILLHNLFYTNSKFIAVILIIEYYLITLLTIN